MKFLFKLIFGLLIFVLLVVGVPLIIVVVTLSDSTNDTPKELYNENITMESELTTLFDAGFDLGDKDYLELMFTEDNLNKIIFSAIRKDLNPDYLPSATSTDDDVNHVKTVEMDLPVVGVKKVIIYSIYAELKDDKLALYMPMNIMGIKTRAKLIATFKEDADNFIIDFDTLGLGKANLLGGLASKIAFTILKQIDFTEDGINDMFEKNGLPLEFVLEDFAFKISKDKINELLEKLINPDEMAESNEKEMLGELLATLTSKSNDLVDFGIFDEKFGIRFDLKKFQVEEGLVTLSDDIKNFDENQFMVNKVQSFIFSNLATTTNKKITFTNKEFNQIVYDQSEGYKEFKIEIPLPETNSTIKFEVIGILIDFNPNDVVIRINIDLNGLKTSFKITGNVTKNNDSEVIIQINDTITVGEDINEEASKYLTANSSLILNMLGDNISDMGVMTYDKTLKSFILSTESFKKLMTVDGNNTTPLDVNKLKIVEDGIEVYTTIEATSDIAQQIETVTNIISNVLETNSFTADDFDIDDPEEAEKVNELLTTLDDIADGLTNGNLSEEDTNKLIENINSISDENRQALLDGIEQNANSADLLALYDSLFGK